MNDGSKPPKIVICDDREDIVSEILEIIIVGHASELNRSGPLVRDLASVVVARQPPVHARFFVVENIFAPYVTPMVLSEVPKLAAEQPTPVGCRPKRRERRARPQRRLGPRRFERWQCTLRRDFFVRSRAPAEHPREGSR